MALQGEWRASFVEIDKSGYVTSSVDETGAMVIKSPKGAKKPKKAYSEDDVLKRYGYPSATNPEVFEAISFVRSAPLWISSALHADARWGGVHVTSGAVTAFSAGNIDPDNYVYTTDKTLGTYTIPGTVNSINKTFSGTLSSVPVDSGSLVLKVGGTVKVAVETAGVISGSDVTSGTLNTTTGDIVVVFTNAPQVGQTVVANWGYNTDASASVSHSFFAASPYTDDLQVKIENVSGSKFKLTLYQTYLGSAVYLTEYNYSLIREKDGYGKNLYILDVFDDNDYLIPKLNSAYAYSTPSLTATTVALAGGKRGTDPTTADYTTSWDYFKKPNKYSAKIFMDVNGNNITDLNTLIQTYQYYSQGISMVPMGNDAAEAITYRSGLGLDTDDVSLYTNWRKIYDPYNDSFAWISNIGSVGKKFAMMADVYDGMSPAGIDENGHGGQISDWRTIEMENDYSDAETKLLDDAQINPIVLDDVYGVVIMGDRTLQVTNSDTSFIHTRRIDKWVIEKIVKQVLRLKEFKLNNEITRLQAQSMVETLVNPLVAKQLYKAARVICDEINNNATVLTNRQFVIDLVKQSVVNNQTTRLNLTRLSQGAVIIEYFPS
jgi:hypothetical protein